MAEVNFILLSCFIVKFLVKVKLQSNHRRCNMAGIVL